MPPGIAAHLPQDPDQRISRFIVLGCGHTGTTLISGILHINGYGSFKVSPLFENILLNTLNQNLLDGVPLPANAIPAFIATLEQRTKGKWCLKDPRLTETIGEYYPHFVSPLKIIYNYRHPGSTVRSLIKERELHESHLSPEAMLRSAEDEWLRRNLAVRNFLDTVNQSPLLITSYDDLVDRRSDEMLCRFVGHKLDLSFIAPTKRHSAPIPVRSELLSLYEELNTLKALNTQEVLRTTRSVPVGVSSRATPRTRVHLLRNRVSNSLRSRTIEVIHLARNRRP